MTIKNKIDLKKVPKHVAIIMDGNGRWAKKRNKNRIFGHKEGANSLKSVIKAAIEINLKYITIYAFSKENWSRPKKEVNALMSLLVKGVNDELSELHEQKIRIKRIGSNENLSKKVLKSIEKATDKTKNNTGLTLIIALNYSSRDEITNAVKKINRDINNNLLKEKQINETLFSKYLSTKNIPDPDLLIRTSGEKRISNFLLWQISYSELFFTDTLWPDFREENFFEIIYRFQQRERRFGKISEQLVDIK